MLALLLSSLIPQLLGNCSFQEVAEDKFEEKHYDSPVVIKHGFAQIAARASKEQFLELFGNETIAVTKNTRFAAEKPEKATMTIEEWAGALKKKKSARYLFSFLQDADHWDLDRRLMEVYSVPQYLRKFSHQRFMVMGSKSKGIALHRHGPSWLGLLAGQKRWFVFPPQAAAAKDMAHRFHTPKELESKPEVKHCVQNAGDVVYIPDDWWHATFDVKNWTVGFGGQVLSEPVPSHVGWVASTGNLSALRQTKFKATKLLLELAAKSGQAEVVEHLLKKKAPLGLSLHKSAEKGHAAVSKMLIEKGADLEQLLDPRRRDTSPLGLAVEGGRANCIELLLRHGADMHAYPPLLAKAARFGHTEAVQALVEAGANINEAYMGIPSALLEASYFGHSAVVGYLLDHGADAAAREQLGRGPSAYDLAAFQGHKHVIDVLQKKAKKRSSEL